MSRWVNYNPNPVNGQRVGDCTVRAISKALNQDWETTYTGLSAMGFQLGNLPDANIVWGRYLRRNGFHQHIVDDYGDDFYTVEEFARDHPRGTFILHIVDPGHVVCVVDGYYYDSFDSGQEVPQYYWTAED